VARLFRLLRDEEACAELARNEPAGLADSHSEDV